MATGVPPSDSTIFADNPVARTWGAPRTFEFEPKAHFDLGHGGGSFYWYVAVPAFEEKFYPDTISTDLHTGSMNAGMKDMINVMSKVLNLGVPVEEVIRMSTWTPAKDMRG